MPLKRVSVDAKLCERVFGLLLDI